MRKYILFVFLIIGARDLSPCPCEFSPEDQRPFFEQYETEIKTVTTQEKEESS